MPGRVPPGEGAARRRGARLVPELLPGALRRETRAASPARTGCARRGGARRGGAAQRELAPGHAGAREPSAAGSAPWTPKQAVARRMTAWTRAPRPEGEPRRAGPGHGRGWGGALSELRCGRSLSGTFLDPAAEPEPLGPDGPPLLPDPQWKAGGLWRAGFLLFGSRGPSSVVRSCPGQRGPQPPGGGEEGGRTQGSE